MRVCLIQIGDNYITKQVRTIILVMGSATRAQSCENDFLVEFFRTAARHKAAPYLKQTTFNSKILAVSKTRKAMRFSGLNTNGGETTIASITITGPFDKGGKSPYIKLIFQQKQSISVQEPRGYIRASRIDMASTINTI